MSKTYDVEIKAQADSQRATGAEIVAEIGAYKWTTEGAAKGDIKERAFV